MVFDMVGGEKGSSGAGEFLAIVGAYMSRSTEYAKEMVLKGGGNGGGSAIGDELEDAKFAEAADGCQQMAFGGRGGAKVGNQVDAPGQPGAGG